MYAIGEVALHRDTAQPTQVFMPMHHARTSQLTFPLHRSGCGSGARIE